VDYEREELDLLIKIVHLRYNKNYICKEEKIILRRLLKKYFLKKIEILTEDLRNGII
jgi:hypothetical protein